MYFTKGASFSKYSMSHIAFSKRKLCNGENFRIKDYDEFLNTDKTVYTEFCSQCDSLRNTSKSI